jgi:hypothetical protein
VLLALALFATGCADRVPTELAETAFGRGDGATTSAAVVVTGLAVDSRHAYTVVERGFDKGAHTYVDQPYTVQAVPSALQGLTFIRTVDADRDAAPGSAEFLSFTIDRAGEIYVAHTEATPRAWMADFVATGMEVVVRRRGGPNLRFHVYRKHFPAGTVTLGSNLDRAQKAAPNMYLVAMAPAAEEIAPTPPPAPDTPVVASVSVSPGSATVDVGATVRLEAAALDASGGVLADASIAWSSSNAAVAEVSGSGMVTGKSAGTATITATSGDASATASVTVTTSQMPVATGAGIWMSAAEIAVLPTSGTAWNSLKKAADSNLSGGVLTERNDHNVRVMAAALVAARLNDNGYRAKVRDALRGVMAAPYGTEDGLARNRRLGTYAVAADLIGLATFDPATDADFRRWLATARDTHLTSGGGGTLAGYHERRPNNYGVHAGFSRVAVALYLGDRAEVERTAQVFRGWLGDRSAYAGFSYGDLAWQADSSRPVGINPRGATKDGRNIDGVLPDDQRRSGGFTWPAPKENYVYEALQGAVALAWVLERQGYDVWNWQDQALLRVFRWLHDVNNYPAEGDDTWQPHIINRAYGTSFPAPTPSRPGKNVGWTDWTHGAR